jgi:hypothetical protein
MCTSQLMPPQVPPHTLPYWSPTLSVPTNPSTTSSSANSSGKSSPNLTTKDDPSQSVQNYLESGDSLQHYTTSPIVMMLVVLFILA